MYVYARNGVECTQGIFKSEEEEEQEEKHKTVPNTTDC